MTAPHAAPPGGNPAPDAAPTPEIRPLTVADVPAVAALEPVLFGAEAWSPRGVEEVLASPWTRAWGVFVGAELLAYAAVNIPLFDSRNPRRPGETYPADLLTIGVRSEWRRRGWARQLLDLAQATAREAGASSLLLEVRASNTAAQNLYTSRGFQTISRRRRYYHLPPEDAVVMEWRCDKSEQTDLS